jgi:hypothetical protein
LALGLEEIEMDGLPARHGRTVTLWEGRYKSCRLVHNAEYPLRCYRCAER